jgi:hypothetical protein
MQMTQDTAPSHETEQQTVQRLADAWNAGADEYNQWGSLSLGEMLRFAELKARENQQPGDAPGGEPNRPSICEYE